MGSSTKANRFYVYCLTEDGGRQGPCKVGVATNLDCRLSSLQGGNPRQLWLEWYCLFQDRNRALDVERHILGRIRSQEGRKRLRSEWLDATPDEVWLAGKQLTEAIWEEESA